MKVHSDISAQMTLVHGAKVSQITFFLQHHVEDLFEMIEMNTWMTQFGVRTEKLRLREDHRHGPVRPAGLAPPSKHSPLSVMALGTHQ